jgi:hypothetical protein
VRALEVIGSIAIAAQRDDNGTSRPAPLVFVEREARCSGCGRRIAPRTEGRSVAPGALVHIECINLFAGPGGR